MLPLNSSLSRGEGTDLTLHGVPRRNWLEPRENGSELRGSPLPLPLELSTLHPHCTDLSHVVEGYGDLGHDIGGVLEAGVDEPEVDLQRFLVLLQLKVRVRREQVPRKKQ